MQLVLKPITKIGVSKINSSCALIEMTIFSGETPSIVWSSPVSHEWKNYFYIIFFVVLVECYTFLIYLVLTSLRKYFALDISRSSLLCESPQLTYFRYKECTNLNMNCFPQHNLIIINTISSSSTQYHHHHQHNIIIIKKVSKDFYS